MKNSDYGILAIQYAKRIIEEKITPSIKGWKKHAEGFGFSDSKIEKVCPRNAFLGLCHLGLVKKIKIILTLSFLFLLFLQ